MKPDPHQSNCLSNTIHLKGNIFKFWILTGGARTLAFSPILRAGIYSEFRFKFLPDNQQPQPYPVEEASVVMAPHRLKGLPFEITTKLGFVSKALVEYVASTQDNVKHPNNFHPLTLQPVHLLIYCPQWYTALSCAAVFAAIEANCFDRYIPGPTVHLAIHPFGERNNNHGASPAGKW